MAITFLQEFAEYLLRPSTLIAVVLPMCVGICWWTLTARFRLSRFEFDAFVLGTAISILCAVWRETDGVLSLHMLPGYALVLAVAPAAYRPDPSRAYLLTWASMFIADAVSAAKYFLLNTGEIHRTFYWGLGGAGVGDALFIVPIGTAAFVYAFTRLNREGWGHVSLLEVSRKLWRSAV